MLMGAKSIDITGQRFGRLVAVRRIGRDLHMNMFWLLRCDCGGEKKLRVGDLSRNRTQHCGCQTAANRKRAANKSTVPNGHRQPAKVSAVLDKFLYTNALRVFFKGK